MKSINTEKIINNASDKLICIIGDVMLDLYLLGEVTRISPEAPVQVFETKKSEPKLGGAANVSLNIKTLGSNPFLIGVVGDDSNANILKSTLKSNYQTTKGIVTEKLRPTTSKTRVISDSHHLIRIDSESKKDISKETKANIFKLLAEIADKIGIIILQDYNKGVLTKDVIKGIIDFAKSKGIKILVDPKFDNFFEYKDVFLFKPNKKEMEDAFGRKAKDINEIKELGKELLNRINCQYLVLTLGEKGIMIFEKSGNDIKISSIKTRARKVADVSGAGDTVISTIAVAIIGGASVNDAVMISNFAAGLVVEEVGIVPIDKELLIKQVNGFINK
ncbi:MAG TPA: PfkB family carbohydrate kinase [Ignavibacteria bacterium]